MGDGHGHQEERGGGRYRHSTALPLTWGGGELLSPFEQEECLLAPAHHGVYCYLIDPVRELLESTESTDANRAALRRFVTTTAPLAAPLLTEDEIAQVDFYAF
jgi:hypothetical protein